MEKIVINVKTGESYSEPFSEEEIKEYLEHQPVAARQYRDSLLKEEVDAIAGNALRWGSLTTEQQQAWADYRQALLDVPQQADFPHEVVWPTKPE